MSIFPGPVFSQLCQQHVDRFVNQLQTAGPDLDRGLVSKDIEILRKVMGNHDNAFEPFDRELASVTDTIGYYREGAFMIYCEAVNDAFEYEAFFLCFTPDCNYVAPFCRHAQHVG